MQNFSEERLDLGYDYGANGGHKWRTTIIQHGGGNEQRNSEWSMPLGRWSVGDRSFYLQQGESLYLKDFFEARRGSFEGFRWRDWSDYQAVNVPIGTGNGALMQFQLFKRYQVGATYYDRIITKPMNLSVKVNGTLQTNWSLDPTRGLVTFTTPPSGSITASFDFDVPVVFVEDSCTLQLLGALQDTGEQLWKISALSVEEVRAKPWSWVGTGTYGTPPDLPLDLGIYNDTNYELNYKTVAFENAGGWRSPRQSWSVSKRKLQFDRTLNRAELTELQNYFWCCHGSHHNFPVVHNGETLNCRFIDDSLSTQFLAADDQDSLWKVSFRLLVFD